MCVRLLCTLPIVLRGRRPLAAEFKAKSSSYLCQRFCPARSLRLEGQGIGHELQKQGRGGQVDKHSIWRGGRGYHLQRLPREVQQPVCRSHFECEGTRLCCSNKHPPNTSHENNEGLFLFLKGKIFFLFFKKKICWFDLSIYLFLRKREGGGRGRERSIDVRGKH